MTQQFLRLVRKVMHCPWALAKKAWDTRDARTGRRIIMDALKNKHSSLALIISLCCTSKPSIV